jgi:hypothetical protein
MRELARLAGTKVETVASLGLMLLDRAEEIAHSARIETRTYRFGPLAVALQAAGPVLSRRLTAAIEFAEVRGADGDAFRVIALDSTAPGVGKLPHWQILEAHSGRLEQQYECRALQLIMRYDADGRTWRVASLARRSAVIWTADARRLPDWEDAAPLRDVLHWACIRSPWFLAHGAAIGSAEGGVLFTGPGGSGKSTTTAAAVLSGLQTAGDDFVLLDPRGLEIHALYDAVKLDQDGLRRLPHFPAEVGNPARSAAGKACFRVSQACASAFAPRLRLRAIVLPRLAQADKTTVLPATESEAMRALAPSTLLLLRGGQAETAAKTAALVRSVPAFRMELGQYPAEVAGALADLVRSLAQ